MENANIPATEVSSSMPAFEVEHQSLVGPQFSAFVPKLTRGGEEQRKHRAAEDAPFPPKNVQLWDPPEGPTPWLRGKPSEECGQRVFVYQCVHGACQGRKVMRYNERGKFLLC